MRNSFSLSFTLFIIFAVLKMFGLITWGWLTIIFAPFLISALIKFSVLIIIGLLVAIFGRGNK